MKTINNEHQLVYNAAYSRTLGEMVAIMEVARYFFSICSIHALILTLSSALIPHLFDYPITTLTKTLTAAFGIFMILNIAADYTAAKFRKKCTDILAITPEPEI